MIQNRIFFSVLVKFRSPIKSWHIYSIWFMCFFLSFFSRSLVRLVCVSRGFFSIYIYLPLLIRSVLFVTIVLSLSFRNNAGSGAVIQQENFTVLLKLLILCLCLLALICLCLLLSSFLYLRILHLLFATKSNVQMLTVTVTV